MEQKTYYYEDYNNSTIPAKNNSLIATGRKQFLWLQWNIKMCALGHIGNPCYMGVAASRALKFYIKYLKHLTCFNVMIIYMPIVDFIAI